MAVPSFPEAPCSHILRMTQITDILRTVTGLPASLANSRQYAELSSVRVAEQINRYA